MDVMVFAAVLAAAAFHAGWNAVIKVGTDPLALTALVTVAAGLVAVPLVPLAGLPSAAAWPWVIASVLVHVFYFIGLIEAYRHGDLSQVYPLARGSAPLMTAAVSAAVLGEWLDPAAWAGLMLLVGGVLLLTVRGGRDRARFNSRAVGYALFTAVTICAYTLVDGIGGRISGNPLAYTAALFVGCGAAMLVYLLARRRGRAFEQVPQVWAKGILGGALQFASYGIAIWAMTVAPIALVAALRETSVLFGALLAHVMLKEPLRPPRAVAAVLIVCGLVLLRLA